MIVGIDFGITTTDVAVFKGRKLRKAFFVPSGSMPALKKALGSNGIDLAAAKAVAVSGGKAGMKSLFGNRVSRVSELDAISFGGAFLSKKKSALVVSMGTGTCMVSLKKGNARHVGGTALGGGTITGLSKRLAGTTDVAKLIALASKGSLKKVDLSVHEAIGSGIGLAPASATASNFVKQGSVPRADLVLAVQNMVAESNAIIAAQAAKALGARSIVFVGKTTLFPAVRRTLKKVLGYYGLSAVFPKHGGNASAVGAALVYGNCFK